MCTGGGYDETRSGFSSTSAAAIYDDCSMLWSGFGEVSVEYCNREANEVAHELARNALISSSSCTWVDKPPSFILNALGNDITLFANQ